MTIDELKEMLESIDGFAGKVAYSHFPEKKAPKLPYICYLETDTNNFIADNQVYQEITDYSIELYENYRDRNVEKLIENKLNEYQISWSRDTEYIDSEKMWLVLYYVEV